ncbi:MAG TPA: DUF4202 family protein [Thermoanaerobaculia bacterium]|nr:DUF4202 family protein [Thermoanaerobaculia bacterium]
MTTIVLRFLGMPPDGAGDGDPAPARLRLDAGEWAAGALEWARFDEQVDELARRGPFAVAVEPPAVGLDADELRQVVDEVEVRCQRWSGRRNRATAGEAASGEASGGGARGGEARRGDWFSAVLARHRAAHPLHKPLVWADYRHVLDVWQWTLRLDPAAGAAVQVAALFHDVERVVSEADARHEQTVADYDAYKARHGEASAQMAARVLAPLALPPGVGERALTLIAGHDRPEAAAPGGERDPETTLLQDADALSFFALNSSGYLDYYGPEQARRKIAWTLRRLSPPAAAWLPRLRLRPEIAALLTAARSAAASFPPPAAPR